MLNHSQIGILGLEKGNRNKFIIPYMLFSEHLKYDFSLYPTIVYVVEVCKNMVTYEYQLEFFITQ